MPKKPAKTTRKPLKDLPRSADGSTMLLSGGNPQIARLTVRGASVYNLAR